MPEEKGRPEAQSFGAAATEAKDSVVDSAKYVKDRVTAPASGDKSADRDVKDVTKEKGEEAKEHGKGVFESISDGAKYVGSRFTASPGGEEHKKGQEKGKEGESGGSWFSQAGDKAQETKDKAGNKLEDKKNKAKESYDDTQNTIADKISTNPAEEAKAHGQIPADTASLSKKE